MCFTCIISFRPQDKPRGQGYSVPSCRWGDGGTEKSVTTKVTYLIGGGCQGQEGGYILLQFKKKDKGRVWKHVGIGEGSVSSQARPATAEELNTLRGLRTGWASP